EREADVALTDHDEIDRVLVRARIRSGSLIRCHSGVLCGWARGAVQCAELRLAMVPRPRWPGRPLISAFEIRSFIGHSPSMYRSVPAIVHSLINKNSPVRGVSLPDTRDCRSHALMRVF